MCDLIEKFSVMHDWYPPLSPSAKGRRRSAEVRAISTQQCYTGLNPALNIISGLSFSSSGSHPCYDGFSLCFLVFFSPQKPIFIYYFQSINSFGGLLPSHLSRALKFCCFFGRIVTVGVFVTFGTLSRSMSRQEQSCNTFLSSTFHPTDQPLVHSTFHPSSSYPSMAGYQPLRIAS